ncbi:uncharacterized protein LOC143907535 [Temnothorax americanus]|uniref:uncharacterized protein LOC143907535 n=1 Tax=Temnothorax americanus TaxID=1964332 RepID=UPI0040690CEA
MSVDRSVTYSNGKTALIFTSNELLQESQKSTELYVDGTFNIVPRVPLMSQLYTIYTRFVNVGARGGMRRSPDLRLVNKISRRTRGPVPSRKLIKRSKQANIKMRGDSPCRCPAPPGCRRRPPVGEISGVQGESVQPSGIASGHGQAGIASRHR